MSRESIVDRLRWKRYTPEIHQMQKSKFLSTNQMFNLDLYCEMPRNQSCDLMGFEGVVISVETVTCRCVKTHVTQIYNVHPHMTCFDICVCGYVCWCVCERDRESVWVCVYVRMYPKHMSCDVLAYVLTVWTYMYFDHRMYNAQPKDIDISHTTHPRQTNCRTNLSRHSPVAWLRLVGSIK